MSELFFADLVQETSVTIGTENFVLNGAISGYRSFSDTVSVNCNFYYAINHVTQPNEWEVGLGYLDGNGLLVRHAITSSNDNDLTDFSTGNKNINLTVSADWFDKQNNEVLAHDHDHDDINGLSEALAAKQDAGDYAPAEHNHSLVDLSLDGASYQTYLSVNNELICSDIISDIIGNSASTVKASALISRRIDAGPFEAEDRIVGGFGARSTSGVKDWNDISNSRSGSGHTLLQSTAANKTPVGTLHHPFNFEYFSKDGGGNITQFAIPYFDNSGYFGMRFRFGGNWSQWRTILYENSSGDFLPSGNNINNLGASSRRFATIFAGTGAINTSDESDKKDISSIPDIWLDAWGDVAWSRYKFRDGKRWHVGLVAQRVHAAFAQYDIDAFDIGLCCCDEWDDEYAILLDDDGKEEKGDLILKAGVKWGLRYDECFALEAAWQRRELKRLNMSLQSLKANQ